MYVVEVQPSCKVFDVPARPWNVRFQSENVNCMMALGINDTYYHLGSQAASRKVSTCTGDHHESFLNFIFYTLLNVTYLSNSLQVTEC